MLIHGKTGSHVCYVSISALEKKLAGSSFFRCHVSYLINLSYIREIRSDSLLMADESIVPVSRHRKKELLSAVAKHIREIL
ncbi:hypothetical protein SDC9_141358 [bioreactor metagenome]|uniref:HTH LytTR-type domain-containing protein n=1 Tax=bioreactor metagenome TaxID=1076179 RepID=A0A645E027_9ZZZZ